MATKPDTSKLLIWWALESDGGDSQGDNDLSAVNGPISHAGGKVGNGADFDYASTQYYTIASPHDGQVGAADFTICGWVKAESWPEKPVYSEAYVCGGTVNVGGVQVKWANEAGGDANAALAMMLYGNDSQPGSSLVIHAGTFVPGNWYFWAMVHDVSLKTLYGYSDTGGSLALNASDTYTFTAASATTRAGNVGKWSEMILDEISIWEAALSLAELQYLFNGGDGIDYDALMSAETAGYNQVDLSLGIRL